MNKYIKFISNHRKPLILLLIILNVLAIIGVTKLNVNAKFDIFKVDHSVYQDSINEMESIYGRNNQVLLLIETKNEVEKTIIDIDSILNKENISFYSPMDLMKILKTDGNVENPLSPIKTDGDTTYITYFLNVEDDYDYKELLEQLDINEETYYLSGDSYMQYEIINLIKGVLTFIPPIALFLVLLTFRTQLGSLKAAFLSVLPAGLGALWTLGLIGWFGGQVSIITVLAPIFAIVIGSADGLHFVTHMEEELNTGTHTEALTHTLSIVGLPMIITTTTSIAGFIGLMLIDTAAIKDLALFASLGVLLAGIITWYVLPLVFTSNITLKHKVSTHSTNSLLKLWGKKSIIISIVLVITSLLFVPNIKTEFNQLMFFRDYTTVQKSFEKIFEANGGAIPLYYYGELNADNVTEKLDDINLLLVHLDSLDSVKKVSNPLAMIGTIDQTKILSLQEYIRVDGDKIFYRFMVFPSDLDNDTIQAIENETLSYNDNLNGELIGSQFLMKEMNESMVKGQVLSIIFTFVVISIMLLFTLKSIRLTIISCLPILLTSITLYGFLGATGISLNLMTCTIFSITLGIGVDYAIHYTSTYKYYRDKGDENPKLLAFKYSSRPVIANAIGLSLGLSSLWLSPLLVHLHISALMWVSMIVAVFTSLTLLPTLLPNK